MPDPDDPIDATPAPKPKVTRAKMSGGRRRPAPQAVRRAAAEGLGREGEGGRRGRAAVVPIPAAPAALDEREQVITQGGLDQVTTGTLRITQGGVNQATATHIDIERAGSPGPTPRTSR